MHKKGLKRLAALRLPLPPAVMPAPLIVLEKETWNCTDMKAPEENPDTDVSPVSTLYNSEVARLNR